jgi:hypothetical protein
MVELMHRLVQHARAAVTRWIRGVADVAGSAAALALIMLLVLPLI